MIELCWFPPGCVVATRAVRDVLARRKLSSMGIDMAAGALLRGGLEINIFQSSLHRRRTVAIYAGNTAMGAQEREFRF